MPSPRRRPAKSRRRRRARRQDAARLTARRRPGRSTRASFCPPRARGAGSRAGTKARRPAECLPRLASPVVSVASRRQKSDATRARKADARAGAERRRRREPGVVDALRRRLRVREHAVERVPKKPVNGGSSFRRRPADATMALNAPPNTSAEVVTSWADTGAFNTRRAQHRPPQRRRPSCRGEAGRAEEVAAGRATQPRDERRPPDGRESETRRPAGAASAPGPASGRCSRARSEKPPWCLARRRWRPPRVAVTWLYLTAPGARGGDRSIIAAGRLQGR